MFTYAAAACLPFTFREVGSIHYSALPAQTWLGIAYVVALATFVSYICLSFAQQRLKPTAVSMYNYCQPVIASSVAVMWSMDHFGWMKVLSVLLVFTVCFWSPEPGGNGRPGTINMPFLRISAATPCRKGKTIPLFAVNMRSNAGSPHGTPCAAPLIMKK